MTLRPWGLQYTKNEDYWIRKSLLGGEPPKRATHLGTYLFNFVREIHFYSVDLLGF